MTIGIRNFPRGVLSTLERFIKAVKALRGQPDGFVGTDADGYATTSHLGSGTANNTTYLSGANTWTVPAGAGDVVGDDVSVLDQNIVAYNGIDGKHIEELNGTQGDVLYYTGTTWARLAAGTDGKVLNTQGAGANPRWSAAAANGIYVDNVTDLITAVAAGGTIYVAAGTYTLTDTLVVGVAGTVICGAERESTIINCMDYDVDIISIRHGRIILKDLIVHHGASFGAGLGSAGAGRGIVIEAPTSVVSHVADVQYIRLSVFNTGSWCFYDAGLRAYEVLASPPGGAETPCYGFDNAVGYSTGALACTLASNKTVTSAALFGNVRVGHYVTGTGIPTNARVIAKASSSSLTISKAATIAGASNLTFSQDSGCGESICVNYIDCVTAFPSSGGCIYVGAGCTTARISALRTNSYSYGSYTTQVGSVTDSLTMGQVHFYSGTGHVIDNISVFQSPADDTVHDDKDATMASFHQTNTVNIFGPYIEILSTNCADGNGGAGGRQYWLFTSMNCEGIRLADPVIVSKVTDPGTADEGYPLRVWKTCADDHVGTELTITGGNARHRRLYYNGTTRVATAPYETGDTVSGSQDFDDFVFSAPEDGTDKRPILIRDFEVINYDGLNHRPPTVDTSSAINARTCFRVENNREHRTGVFDDSDLSGFSNESDDFRARTSTFHALRGGIFAYCRGVGRKRISGNVNSTTNLQSDTAGDFATIVVGQRVEGNGVPADTYVTALVDTSNVTMSAAATLTGGPFAYSFYAPGTYQREGHWGVSTAENDVRQIPWIRKHTSAGAGILPGDLWMKLSGTLNLSVYPSAELHFYDGGRWVSAKEMNVPMHFLTMGG